MFPVFNLDMESRMTLTSIKSQEQDLNQMLRKLSRIRDFLSKKSSDQLSGSYNDDFNELTAIQDKCRTAYTNINEAKRRLTQCNKQIIEINKVLSETKQILNSKKVGKLKNIARTYVLDNIDNLKKDIDNESPLQHVMNQIGAEDPNNYDDFEEEEEEYDPYDEDPLYGTHNAPRGGKHSGKHSGKQKKRTRKTRNPKQNKNTRKKIY